MYIYVAGPYTNGSTAAHVRNAILAGDELLARGHVPFVPHLGHFWDVISDHNYDEWMAFCLAWVKRCDAVLRLPGKSRGADLEVQCARQNDLLVFYDLDEIPGLEDSGFNWVSLDTGTTGGTA